MKKVVIVLGVLFCLAVFGNVVARVAEESTSRESRPKSEPRWVPDFDVNAMDRRVSVSLTLHPDGVPESIHLECESGKISAYVSTGAILETEFRGGEDIRFRFGDGLPTRQRWQQSTDGTALFSPASRALVSEMEKREHFLFEYTPFRHRPRTVDFDLSGLKLALDPIRKACGLR